eukprot:2878176-Amphidinium_carterae.1
MATRLYLHGGADDKKAYGDLHLLEIEAMKWTELSTQVRRDDDRRNHIRCGTAPLPRYGHSMKAYNADLVLFGGLVTDGSQGVCCVIVQR